MEFWDNYFVLVERLSYLRRLKCNSVIEKRHQSVSFIERYFHCVVHSKCPFFGGSTVVAIKAFLRLGQFRCRIKCR